MHTIAPASRKIKGSSSKRNHHGSEFDFDFDSTVSNSNSNSTLNRLDGYDFKNTSIVKVSKSVSIIFLISISNYKCIYLIICCISIFFFIKY